MSLLKDEIIFVTGATAGFGEACARLFLKEGAKVVFAGRRKDRLELLQKEFGSNAFALELDVRNREEVGKRIETLPPAFRELTALVNNAGLALGLENAQEASLDDWDQMIDTNCKGLVYCTRAVLPGLVKRNRGHVINIGSIAANYPYAGGNVYGATKAFVKQFSLNLKTELLGTDLRITNVEPGMAETEFSEVRFRGDKERAKQVYERMQPLIAEDIAETCLWCLTRPAHVNINRIELMPVAQGPGGLATKRN